jgi:hypothetical protein
MRRMPIPRPARRGLLLGLLALPVLAPAPAGAGVPRSCIHPQANPIECPKDTRKVLLKVIPSARRRALREQRPELERTFEARSLRRDRLLEEILGTIRGEDPRN